MADLRVLNGNAFSVKQEFAIDHTDGKLLKKLLNSKQCLPPFLGLTELCRVHSGHEETGVNGAFVLTGEKGRGKISG